MNYVEISDLLSKGFTPEQIMLLVSAAGGNSGDNPGNDPGKNPEQKDEKKPDPEQDPGDNPEQKEEQKENNPDNKNTDPAVDALRNEIKSLRETLQKQNIVNQHFDNPPDSADAEKILAGIIRPAFEEPDKK